MAYVFLNPSLQRLSGFGQDGVVEPTWVLPNQQPAAASTRVLPTGQLVPAPYNPQQRTQQQILQSVSVEPVVNVPRVPMVNSTVAPVASYPLSPRSSNSSYDKQRCDEQMANIRANYVPCAGATAIARDSLEGRQFIYWYVTSSKETKPLFDQLIQEAEQRVFSSTLGVSAKAYIAFVSLQLPLTKDISRADIGGGTLNSFTMKKYPFISTTVCDQQNVLPEYSTMYNVCPSDLSAFKAAQARLDKMIQQQGTTPITFSPNVYAVMSPDVAIKFLQWWVGVDLETCGLYVVKLLVPYINQGVSFYEAAGTFAQANNQKLMVPKGLYEYYVKNPTSTTAPDSLLGKGFSFDIKSIPTWAWALGAAGVVFLLMRK